MPRKRVNTRFLAISGIVLVALVVVVFASQRLLTRGNAKEFWEMGDRYMAQEKYKEAKESYARALRLDPSNVAGWVKYGDSFHELVRFSLDEMGKDTKSWERALELNPAYVPALTRLVDAYADLAELDPSPNIF